MEKKQYQYEGLKWLFELEFLNSPQVINTIKFNILTVSKRIKDVELLIYRENKTMLVLVNLSWLGRKFFKNQIFIDIEEVLVQLLPSFRFRVTDDPNIMKLAVELVNKALTGGSNESAINNNVADTQSTNKQDSGGTSKVQPESESNTDPSKEKSSEIGSIVLDAISTDDTKQKS